MKGGFFPVTLNSFSQRNYLKTTGQRPPSPESDDHLTHHGGYR